MSKTAAEPAPLTISFVNEEPPNSKPKKGGSNPRQRTPKFKLTTQRVALILGILTLIGGVFTAAINNLDKLNGSTRSDIETLLKYNEQRMNAVNKSFDDGVERLQRAKEELSRQKGMTEVQCDLQAVENVINTAKARKAAVNVEYQNLTKAVQSGEHVQADIHKSNINEAIMGTQRDADRQLSTPTLREKDLALKLAPITEDKDQIADVMPGDPSLGWYDSLEIPLQDGATGVDSASNRWRVYGYREVSLTVNSRVICNGKTVSKITVPIFRPAKPNPQVVDKTAALIQW